MERTRPSRTRTVLDLQVSTFGLSVRADFPIVGAPAVAHPYGLQTSVRQVRRADLTAPWNGRDRVAGVRPDGADTGIRLGYDGELGYLLDLPDAGLFSVSPDGRVIWCSPLKLESWRWQRGLFSGPLPLAAVVRGVEVFHAGAVVMNGRLIAITGPSGSGKTSLTSFLRLAGARFFTDDVLALKVREQVIAYPGPPLLNLRESTARLLSSSERLQLGSVVGADRAQARISTEPFASPQPVAALYVLERRPDAARLTFEPVRRPSRLLLASSYNFVVRSGERLLRQLDLCSRLSKAIPVIRVVVPATVDPRTLSAAIVDYEQQSYKQKPGANGTELTNGL